MNNIREQFPILKNGLIYLDSASTAQKPQVVVDSLVETYTHFNSNVHRGMYPIAQEVDRRWIKAHEQVSNFINANPQEVFFVKNATEGLNIIALIMQEQFLTNGDVVAVSSIEHHSNYLPWKRLEKKGVTLKVFEDINELESISDEFREKLKVVSIVHMSNVTGKIIDIKRVSEIVHRFGGIVCVDGTQSVVHMDIDVMNLDADFFVFSGHKVYGPNGVGVVYGKKNLLEKIEPVFQGGEMVESVSKDITYAKLPFKFEAGTPNIADGISFGVALEWLKGIKGKFEYEKELSIYLYNQLISVPGVNIMSEPNSPICSFNINKIHPHDIASDLGDNGICVRAGYHCAQPLHEKLGLKGSVRVSLGIYNNIEDIDSLIKTLKEIIKRYE